SGAPTRSCLDCGDVVNGVFAQTAARVFEVNLRISEIAFVAVDIDGFGFGFHFDFTSSALVHPLPRAPNRNLVPPAQAPPPSHRCARSGLAPSHARGRERCNSRYAGSA